MELFECVISAQIYKTECHGIKFKELERQIATEEVLSIKKTWKDLKKLTRKEKMKNKKLRESFKSMRCLVCNRIGSDPCHIRSYATTLKDEESNLMPLCREHHVEQHKIGIITFIKKYPTVLRYVTSIGYEIDYRGKLVRSVP